MKPVRELLPSDLTAYRVWEFVDDMEAQLPDETYMRPVEGLPVDSLSGRLASAHPTLANGDRLLALLGNIDLSDPVSTEHFLTITVFSPSGERFDLDRYHDIDYASHDPAALAAFLLLPLEAVFPIRYDVSDIAVGHAKCLRRSIPTVPASRLTKEQLIALSLK